MHGRKVRWYSAFLFFAFLFRSNNKKKHLDENDFRHGYDNYFKSAVLKVTWYQLRSKSFLDNYEAHWQRHLKDTLQMKILRTWINIHANSFFGKYHEMIMTMVPWKLSVAKKSEPVLSRASHQDISLIIVVFASRTNLIYGGLSLWWNQ